MKMNYGYSSLWLSLIFLCTISGKTIAQVHTTELNRGQSYVTSGSIHDVNNEASDLVVYPNPSSSYIVLGMGNEESLFEAVIMEARTGQLIKRILLKDKIQILDINQYQRGLYILQLIDEYGEIREIKKVIKE